METCFLMQANDILPKTCRDSGADQETKLTKGHADSCRRCSKKPSKANGQHLVRSEGQQHKNINAELFLNKSELAIYIWAQTLPWSGHLFLIWLRKPYSHSQYTAELQPPLSSFLSFFPQIHSLFSWKGWWWELEVLFCIPKWNSQKTVEASNIFTGGQYHYVPHQHNIDDSGD